MRSSIFLLTRQHRQDVIFYRRSGGGSNNVDMQSSQDRNSEVQIDPLVASLTADQIDKDVAEYDALLDRNTSEAELHAFLARHTYFFNGYLRLLGNSPVYSKVKLGSDHEVDFAWFDTSSFGPEWHLVEIEPSRCKLFTRDGNPTAELTHAIQQVRDWNSWVHRYLDYARKIMPQIEYPVCHVFLGRRSELTEANTPKLRRFVHEHRAYLSLHTLDALSGAALSVKGLLQDGSVW